ncbi:TniB family NTP-binding protein [Pseudomonas atacamensis]|nr:TniB family NTP-binding protein [Pseudomonas atacamensis]
MIEFSKQTVFFPSYQFAYSQLSKAVEATGLRKTGSCAFIIGPSGCGKSRLCELFADSFTAPYVEHVDDELVKIITALYCIVPAPVTIKGICKTLLKTLGAYPPQTDVHALNALLIDRLKKCRVRVVILDEIQRLLKPEAEKTRSVTLDWLVTLLSESKIPIMLAGTKECELLLKEQKKKSHLPFIRRYCYVAYLTHFKFSELETSELCMTLKVLDQQLYKLMKFEGDVHLHDLLIMAPLFVASAGNLEYLRQIVYEAVSSTLTRSVIRLARRDFAEACRCLSLPKQLSEQTNPFNMTLTQCLALIAGYNDEKANLCADSAR